MGQVWNGLLLVDKPAGPTSHDVVDQLRRATGQRRVGHAGTLDPMATGLLPLVLGRATRLVRYMPDSPKGYRGTIRLGLTTSTDDVTGETLTVFEGSLPRSERVTEAAEKFRGRLEQRPPCVSARRVAGRRMYRLAREGRPVDARPTEVEVRRFRLEPTGRPELFGFEAEVSSGTYIRALARDLGAALGCGGTLASLTRTHIGPISLDGALALPADEPPSPVLLRAALIPLDRMPLVPPPFRLQDEEQARRFGLGGALEVRPASGPDGRYRVLAPSGALLGVAELAAGRLQPRVVVADPGESPERAE